MVCARVREEVMREKRGVEMGGETHAVYVQREQRAQHPSMHGRTHYALTQHPAPYTLHPTDARTQAPARTQKTRPCY